MRQRGSITADVQLMQGIMGYCPPRLPPCVMACRWWFDATVPVYEYADVISHPPGGGSLLCTTSQAFRMFLW